MRYIVRSSSVEYSMTPDSNAIDILSTLTPAHRQQVIDFITFLKAKEQADNRQAAVNTAWEDEPFFGLWTDRTDLQDSGQWVRQIRQQQWSRM
ncbi:MAG: hypothetical protein RLZZ511_2196 [Cyanobacteriota bacterium]|jgi:hypothetical protein